MEPLSKELTVDLGDRSYPIYIGSGLLDTPALWTRHIRSRQVMLVSNTTVAPLYLEQVRAALSGFTTATAILPDGEEYKTLGVMEQVIGALLGARFDRHCTLVALGGGVIGDTTGFAASCYQRGVSYLQIPTTLLAQVDSSVGGKTAVNHALGKNMIGAFHQPICVVADIDTLATLPDRELHAGLAEVIKYGLINDPEFFAWLEHNIGALLDRDPAAVTEAVQRSCRNKATIVGADERETGARALLNLGHTFGHAIETALGYGTWLHGEAVSAGMLLAADLSRRLGWIDSATVTRIETLLRAAYLPVRIPHGVDAAQLLQLMAVDKKAQDGMIRLVLLQALGHAVVTSDYSRTALLETLNEHVLQAQRG
jgi:3-dehydroquinate synthase